MRVASGWSRRHTRSSSSSAYAGPGAPRVCQAPIRIVIGEEQCTDTRPAAFRVGPADDDKLLAIETLSLDPKAAITGAYTVRRSALTQCLRASYGKRADKKVALFRGVRREIFLPTCPLAGRILTIVEIESRRKLLARCERRES